MTRSFDDRQLTGLEAEILGEKIATYVRIARTLERLVEEAVEARQEAVAARGPRRHECRSRFAGLREQAGRYLWYLRVQREALGLRHDAGLEQLYPLPGELADHEG